MKYVSKKKKDYSVNYDFLDSSEYPLIYDEGRKQ